MNTKEMYQFVQITIKDVYNLRKKIFTFTVCKVHQIFCWQTKVLDF